MADAVETVSPLVHRDADRLCIVARTLTAECSGCGRVIQGNVHMPMVGYGFFCSGCCVGCRYQASQAELALLEANRVRARAGVVDDAKRQKQWERAQRKRAERRGRVWQGGNGDDGEFLCPGANLASGRKWRAYVAAHPPV
jgi:hypothetical protein